MSQLKNALQQADIRVIVQTHFPQAIQGNRVRCIWRKGQATSGAFYCSGNKWRLRDHATGEDHDAYDFLVKVLGYSKSCAAQEIMKSLPKYSVNVPISEFEQWQQQVKSLQGSGFIPKSMPGSDLKAWFLEQLAVALQRDC
jgi:hypothetical protein